MNIKDKDGHSLLHEACEYRDLDTVKCLVDNANVNTEDAKRLYPIN